MIMIQQLECSVFNTDAIIIAHQVNCMGVMGSGVAKQVKEKYPSAFHDYQALCQANCNNRRSLLGIAQIC